MINNLKLRQDVFIIFSKLSLYHSKETNTEYFRHKQYAFLNFVIDFSFGHFLKKESSI